MFDNASRGEYLDSEHALSEKVRNALGDDFKGDAVIKPTNIIPYPSGKDQIDGGG